MESWRQPELWGPARVRGLAAKQQAPAAGARVTAPRPHPRRRRPQAPPSLRASCFGGGLRERGGAAGTDWRSAPEWRPEAPPPPRPLGRGGSAPLPVPCCAAPSQRSPSLKLERGRPACWRGRCDPGGEPWGGPGRRRASEECRPRPGGCGAVGEGPAP